MRIARLITGVLLWGAFAVFAGAAPANAQSLEQTYDATLAAYNSTLNELETCAEDFSNWQEFARDKRPDADAPKAEWDGWARSYRHWAEAYVGCLRQLKKEADDLKRKLDELQRQLDGAAPSTETREEPSKEAKDKARNLLNKGRKDLEGWTLNVRYKIGQANRMNQAASADVEKHGSGEVKIEPRFEYKF